MTIETYTVTKITADEGMILTDKATETMRSKVIYLADGDSPENYIEIPDEPVPDPDTQEALDDEAEADDPLE